MKNNLMRIGKGILYYIKDDKKILGAHNNIIGYISDIYGDTTNIYGCATTLEGDVSNLKGNITGIKGNATGIYGDLDKCELTNEDRQRGIDIQDLI